MAINSLPTYDGNCHHGLAEAHQKDGGEGVCMCVCVCTVYVDVSVCVRAYVYEEMAL